jgi:DNA-binding beta-propeller fold protein YncE
MRKSFLYIAVLAMTFSACKEEKMEIPAASSVADFSITVAGDYAPVTVSLTNKSINAKGYTWDFGNGTTSTEKDPAPVQYNEPGLFTISLEVEPMQELHYNKLNKSVYVNVLDPNAGKVRTLYYTSRSTGKVHYIRLDGGDPVVFDFPTGGFYKPYGIAIDTKNGKVYVSDTDGFIYRFELNGDNQEVVLSEEQVPMLDAPYGILVIEDKLYWAREGGIYMCSLDGSDPQPFKTFDAAPELPLGMAFDSIQQKIYFVNDKYDFSGGVYTINIDGSGLAQIIEGVDAGAIALDLKNSKLYYADWVGGVFMANLDGSGVANINSYFDSKFCWGIAVEPDSGYLFVPDRYDDGIIFRSGLDGSNPTEWITGVNAYAMTIDIYR